MQHAPVDAEHIMLSRDDPRVVEAINAGNRQVNKKDFDSLIL